MRNSFVRLSLFICSVLMLGVVGNAQTAPTYRAEVPFDFQATGRHYTAGLYSVGSIGNGSNGAVTLREKRTGKMKILGLSIGSTMRNSNDAKLIFKRVGSQYILWEIQTPQFELKVKSGRQEGRLAKVSAYDELVAIQMN